MTTFSVVSSKPAIECYPIARPLKSTEAYFPMVVGVKPMARRSHTTGGSARVEPTCRVLAIKTVFCLIEAVILDVMDCSLDYSHRLLIP